MSEKISPYTFINSINGNKTQPYSKEYVPFITARTLSYFPDTLLFANLVSTYFITDPEMHYDFFQSIVKPRKRFSKWGKLVVNPNIKLLSEFYQISLSKAEEIISLYSDEEIDKISESMKLK